MPVDNADFRRFREALLPRIEVYDVPQDLSSEARANAASQMRELYIQELYRTSPPEIRNHVHLRAQGGDLVVRLTTHDTVNHLESNRVGPYVQPEKPYGGLAMPPEWLRKETRILNAVDAKFDQQGNITRHDPLLARRALHENSHGADFSAGISNTPNWANARKLDKFNVGLAQEVIRHAQASGEHLAISNRSQSAIEHFYAETRAAFIKENPNLATTLPASASDYLAKKHPEVATHRSGSIVGFAEAIQDAYVERVGGHRGQQFIDYAPEFLDRNVRRRITDLEYYKLEKATPAQNEQYRNMEAFAKFTDAEHVNLNNYGEKGRNPLTSILTPNMQEVYYDTPHLGLPQIAKNNGEYAAKKRLPPLTETTSHAAHPESTNRKPSDSQLAFHYEKFGSSDIAKGQALALKADLEIHGVKNVSVVRTRGEYHNSPAEFNVMVEGVAANVARAKTFIASHQPPAMTTPIDAAQQNLQVQQQQQQLPAQEVAAMQAKAQEAAQQQQRQQQLKMNLMQQQQQQMTRPPEAASSTATPAPRTASRSVFFGSIKHANRYSCGGIRQ